MSKNFKNVCGASVGVAIKGEQPWVYVIFVAMVTTGLISRNQGLSRSAISSKERDG